MMKNGNYADQSHILSRWTVWSILLWHHAYLRSLCLSFLTRVYNQSVYQYMEPLLHSCDSCTHIVRHYYCNYKITSKTTPSPYLKRVSCRLLKPVYGDKSLTAITTEVVPWLVNPETKAECLSWTVTAIAAESCPSKSFQSFGSENNTENYFN